MFGIFPANVVIEENDELVLPASIVIDSFSESFKIPLAYWGLKDYRIHWINSLSEGLKNKNHSVLAVSMYEPGTTNFIFTWALYFSDEDVFVQNNVIFIDECPGFASEKINNYLEPRATFNEDGVKISEWRTDLKSVVVFYNELKKSLA